MMRTRLWLRNFLPNKCLHEEESWFSGLEKFQLPRDLQTALMYPEHQTVNAKKLLCDWHWQMWEDTGWSVSKALQATLKKQAVVSSLAQESRHNFLWRLGMEWFWRVLGTAVTPVSITWSTTVITWTPTTTASFTMLFDPRKPWCYAMTSKLLP